MFFISEQLLHLSINGPSLKIHQSKNYTIFYHHFLSFGGLLGIPRLSFSFSFLQLTVDHKGLMILEYSTINLHAFAVHLQSSWLSA